MCTDNMIVWLRLLCLMAGMTLTSFAAGAEDRWSDAERAAIDSLWIGNLEPVPPDPSNRFADDPRAAAFGRLLFFDTRLSSSGQVSCASCHLPARDFQDDLPQGRGVGTTNRRTMPIAGTAYSRFLFWDGRKDSLWAQALGPLESSVEHGGNRGAYAHVIAKYYREHYEPLFGALPDLSSIPANAGPVDNPEAFLAWQSLSVAEQEQVTTVFVNLGKAIAAYERLINFAASRFDRYAEALRTDAPGSATLLNDDEKAGLKLFIGKAHCLQCHNGPLFSNQEFHNTGVPALASLPPDAGRLLGARQVIDDEFNCRSRWSDSNQCPELDYMVVDAHEQARAFKVPTLRNTSRRAPYMHAGQFATLDEVLQHYSRAPAAPGGSSELHPLRLRDTEIQQLQAFLQTLEGGFTVSPELLMDPFTASSTDDNPVNQASPLATEGGAQ